jgi:flagellar hook-basal body complex protein FliE
MEEITLNNDANITLGSSYEGKQKTPDNAESFGTMLKDAIHDVNKLQQEADQSVQQLAGGQGIDIHQTMIAVEKAEISFQLMMQVRNKIIAAYEEIMRMQI